MPIILGMCDPSGKEEPLAVDDVPDGAAGVRLWRMSRMTREQWLSSFERVNLLPGKTWDQERAARFASAFREVHRGRLVVALGGQVWRAFSLRRVAPCRAIPGGWPDSTFVFVPHPSGRNHFYNEPSNRRRVGALLRRLASVSGEQTDRSVA